MGHLLSKLHLDTEPSRYNQRIFEVYNRKCIQDYFFDPDLLTDGAPPNDRGCRACGKIGHLVADCPRKKAADQRKKQAKDRQRSMSEQPEGGKAGAQTQASTDGGRNRTRSEIPPQLPQIPPGNKEGSGELSGVSTDIRYKEASQIKKKDKVKDFTDALASYY